MHPILNMLRPGDLVFDIGAHIGNKTAMYRAAGARVVAVEPQPLCEAHLRQRFASDPDVVIVSNGVGARTPKCGTIPSFGNLGSRFERIISLYGINDSYGNFMIHSALICGG